MASSQTTGTLQKKKNNYKLLIDPELKKGPKKVYRLNGKDEPGFPPCGTPKDPRAQKTVLGLAGSSVEYKLPRFKYDKFWEGEPPMRDVFVIGLNESVKSSLFKEVCEGIGEVYSMKFHRHPKSKTFLGAATVSFVHSGVGSKAVGELDGKVIGGCYLRAELDDSGAHLKKYLEPVLKKCGLDKKPAPASKQPPLGKSSVSDSETGLLRNRSNSTAESIADASEADADTPQHVTSAATTPITPTVKGDTLPNFPPLFQFSILNVETPSSSEGMGGGGFSSPSFATPCTPSSIDSGISIRTQNILSPGDVKMKRPALLSTLSSALPPLPPEESAPPLPPQDVEAPPPLPPTPPLPFAPGEEQGGSGGIENISSDEDDTKTKLPQQPALPVFPSPSSSPHPSAATSNHTFDPSLGLKSLLMDQLKGSGAGQERALVQPYSVSSPKPAYELEVEEISGDESPVMVYFEPLKVESISDDDDTGGGGGVGGVAAMGGGGGDDMDISDNENEQENVIEVNVNTARVFPAAAPGAMMEPHPPPHLPPLPPYHPHHPHHHMGMPPPPGFFPPPHHPHPLAFLPPQPPHHPYPPGPGGYSHHHHHGMFPPAGRSPPPPPHHGRRGRGEESSRGSSRRHDTSSPGPIIRDHQVPRPPNGYIGSSYHHGRSYSKSKVLRNFPSPKNKTEGLSQDVLFRAMEQLRLILLNDVHKKIVENSAYPVLDQHWKKREEQKSSHSSHPAEGSGEKDDPTSSRSVEPYRRMLPGMKIQSEEPAPKRQDKEERGEGGGEEEEGEEGEEGESRQPALATPRKRLMNFRIPLVRGSQRRDQQHSAVATRRLFKEDSKAKGQDEPAPSKPYSDISSSEDFSSSESEREEEEEEGGKESSEEEDSEPSIEQPSSDSDSDFEKLLNSIRRKRKTSGDVKERTKKLKQKAPQRKRKKPATDVAEDGPKLYRDKENLVGKEEEEEGMEEVEVLETVPLKPRYKKRQPAEEQRILESFLEEGLDKEDVQMFKLAYAQLKEEGDPLVEDIPWAHYPHIPPSAPPPPPTKRRRVSKYSVPEAVHVTGCARSEGYYKIDMREKVKYLPHHKLKSTTVSTAEQKKSVKSSGRVNRANQRKLASLYSAGDMSSDLAKYNQFKARKKQLKFAKSTIHNWGLFAMESIPADEMVIEYVGQVVRQCVADEREKRYEAAGIGSSYLFRVDHDYIIDATKRGGLARFINHCCDPNCYAKVINFSTGKKIVIYSKRDIAMGEEITYDYKFPIEDEKIPCLCGAPNCRGTLN